MEPKAGRNDIILIETDVAHPMNFEGFFKLVSYCVVACGFLSLCISGTFGIISSVLFIALMLAAWKLEGSRWQISERFGTVLIVLALPAFYLGWRFQLISVGGGEAVIAGLLARMILSLACIKLLQKKSDRDWIFLYLMAFFEVLLAAGLSISALYLLSFLVYLLAAVSAIIAFEIRKTSRAVEKKINGDKTHERDPSSESKSALPIRRLPTAAVMLILCIIIVAFPLFFVLPRVGGAGLGASALGQNTFSGFSDSVRLGGIGQIQQSDEIVMRVKIEGDSDNLYFRGVALDTFDNKIWSKSKTGNKIAFERGEGDMLQVDFSGIGGNRTVQTIYLEPLDTPVLFALPRAIAMQGNFPAVFKDAYGSISLLRSFERVSYKVVSDRSLPSESRLIADNSPYHADVGNYLTLPAAFDPRIAQLATNIAEPRKTRYEKARAIESYLQNNIGYTLEQKAGGDEPLADFLFNVREGHCEYFATAMAIMLRTQGIATRIVNGFHGGEYNDAADMTIVRQRNAHAWVEVYFPGEDVWVPFDPTPPAGQPTTTIAGGITGSVQKYMEALESFWIQHFVAYDDQEQRSLAHSMRNGLTEYQVGVSLYLTRVQNAISQWWAEVRGDNGLRSSVAAIGSGVATVVGALFGIVMPVVIYRRFKASQTMQRIRDKFFKRRRVSIVEFYERLQRILKRRGFSREPYQTPLEFAFASGIPEAVNITEKYNRVRFGEKELSSDEANEIEAWLHQIEKPSEN
jgi:hypothetical protein